MSASSNNFNRCENRQDPCFFNIEHLCKHTSVRKINNFFLLLLNKPKAESVGRKTCLENISARNPSDFLPEIAGKEMDVVEMILMERATGIPLDLIILIRSFLYEKLTDANFCAAVELWFGDEEKCRFKFDHISSWNTSRVTNMNRAFSGRARFDGDLSRWNVANMTDMSYMFYGASQFNGDLSRWNVAKVTNMRGMFGRATQFNGDLSQWNVSRVIDMSCMFYWASHFDRDLSRWDIGRLEMWNTFRMFDGSPQSIERYTGTSS
jgi:surface protein